MTRLKLCMSRVLLASACLSASLACLPGCGGGPPTSAPGPYEKSFAGKHSATPRDDWEEKTKDPAITVETFYAAGQLAESQEAWPRAIKQYRKALELRPNHLESLFRLGVIYSRFHQFPEAIAAWDQYIQASGGDATGYANLGFCYELAGRTEEAETTYRRGVQKDPTNAPCRVNYGLMLARHRKFNEATLQLQAVLGEAEVHYNLASVYESLGRREQAKTEYQKALDLDPKMKEAEARLDALN